MFKRKLQTLQRLQIKCNAIKSIGDDFGVCVCSFARPGQNKINKFFGLSISPQLSVSLNELIYGVSSFGREVHLLDIYQVENLT